MARFTYKGIPVRDTQGNVVAVLPVRGLVAPDGKTYPGILATDAEGNRFTYRQVPNDYSPAPLRRWDDTLIWNDADVWQDYEVA